MNFRLVSTLILTFITFSNVQANDSFSIENAWIREAPPTISTLAGFMTLHNHSDQALIVESFTSPDFKQIELHKTAIDNGVAKMQKQGPISVPANQSLTLEPGGFHLMLIDAIRPLKVDDTTLVTIHYNGHKQTMTFSVKKTTGTPPSHRHHHN